MTFNRAWSPNVRVVRHDEITSARPFPSGGPSVEKIAVGAVVTAFHPDSMLDQLIEQLAHQVSHIVVVDNTPGHACTADGLRSVRNVTYIHTGENLGLAAALNRGVRYLRRVPLSHISFWDQDSLPPRGYIRDALARSRSFAEWPNVIVGGYHVTLTGVVMRGMNGMGGRAVWLITSGMIVPVSTLRSVGIFREDFFIDAVDMDFSLRARARGISLYGLQDLMIRHRFGDPSRSRKPPLLGTKTSGHPAWRHYWIARNQSILVDEYRHIDIEAVRAIKKSQRSWFLRDLLAGPERFKLISVIVAGWRDGRKGRIRKRYDPRTT